MFLVVANKFALKKQSRGRESLLKLGMRNVRQGLGIKKAIYLTCKQMAIYSIAGDFQSGMFSLILRIPLNQG
jgi:hypothetical protein